VLRLHGIPIADDDARHLVTTLFAGGAPAAVAAAGMIAKGIERDLYTVGLNPEMRDAILSVLEDPPDGLVELRGKLARDHVQRAR
jgi:hypothetical protein